MSSADDLSKRPSLSGLTKLTRADLAERAAILGLPVSAADRRIDLIERIRGSLSARETPPQPKSGIRKVGGKGNGPARKKSLQAQDAPVRSQIPVPEATATRTVVVLSGDQSARDEIAPGWKYFLDIPYEPVRRELGHAITILPIDPHRIIAFFSIDWMVDPDLPQKVRESGVVLKIRDITGAMQDRHTAHKMEEYPADHVFDITAGTEERWSIPLWSSHRYLEAWLGYYQGQNFRILARSKRIRTPRGKPSSQRGSLFHFQEGAPLAFPTTEASWEYSISRRWIKLPTSRDFPGSHTIP
jgi:hypothetical protein